jgi:NADPH:quinone reductase-like Zn-dependent oxidoreductase
MKALVTLEEKKAGVQEKPIPPIAADEVLTKVIAVALNPTDCMFFPFSLSVFKN